MKTIIIAIMTLALSQMSLANDDSDYDFSPSDSGSSSGTSSGDSNANFTFVTSREYEADTSSDGMRTFGGGQDFLSRNQSSDESGGDRSFDSRRNSDGASSSSGLFGWGGLTSSGTSENRDPEPNPMIAAIIGQVQNPPPSGVQQSFSSLFVRRSPYPLLLDLDGNGTRGDLTDGLLYNLLFPEQTEASSHQSLISASGRNQSISRQSIDAKWKRELDRGLSHTMIPLTADLGDGRKEVKLFELLQIFNGLSHLKFSKEEKIVAFESLLRLVVLQPTMGSTESPLVQRLAPQSRDAHQGLSWKLKLNRLASSAGLSDVQKLTRQSLEFDVSISRFITVATLHDHARKEGIQVTDFARDAIRAAFYGMAYSLKRLNVNEEERSKLLVEFINHTGEASPQTVQLMAEQVASTEELKRLSETIFRRMPVIETSKAPKEWVRKLVTLSAAATSVAAWMSGGMKGVEVITSDIGHQFLLYHAGYLVFPVISYVTTRIGISKWASKNHDPIFTKGMDEAIAMACRKVTEKK